MELRGLKNQWAELLLRLRENSIPILALTKGALPGEESLLGYVKYTVPLMRTFPHGSTLR